MPDSSRPTPARPCALVTRPAADAAPLVAALAERGIDTLSAPLLTITPVAAALPDLGPIQAVLATSANGIRALAEATPRRDLAVWAVGDGSAEVARELGFGPVESAAGDAAALAELVAERLKPAAGPLLHVAGSDVAGDLKGRLEAAGFTVERAVLYRAEPVPALPPDAAAALTAGRVDWVLLYSPRTAALFRTLAESAGLGRRLASVKALCLSPAVADALGDLAIDRTVAATPDRGGMMALVERLLAERQPAPAPVPATARSGRGVAVAAAAGVIGGLVVAAATIAAYPTWRVWFPPPANPAAAGIERRIAALETAVSQPGLPARIPADVDARLDRLEAAVGQARSATPAAPSDLPDQVAALRADLQSAKAAVAQIDARMGADDKARAAVDARLTAAGQAAERIGALAEQIAGVQDRLAKLEQGQQAGAEELRRAALALAVAQVAEPARAGQAFDQPLQALALLAGPDLKPTLAALQPGAKAGVPTAEQLTRSFPAAARAAVQAETASGAAGWLGRVDRFVTGLVTVRRTDPDAPAASLDAKLAAAEQHLADRDLPAAAAALSELPPRADAALKPWLDQARARVALDRALSQLTEQALGSLARG